tara:strand:- start:38 stop:1000 length:963 start_codon:yes stop_codon:yes gene_type:complete
MDEMIQTSDAAQAPQGNPEIPVENAGMETPAGTEGNLFPLGGGETITNTEGLPVGQTAPLVSEEPVQTQEPVPTESPVREDPSRMEYWQSQTDRAKNENYQLKQELDYYQNSLGPVAEMIQRNPQVLDTLEQTVNGQPPGAPVQAGNQRNPLDKPIRPTKPTTYNEVDAYNDPESDSFKFRAQNDQWRDGMLDYYENLDSARMQQAEQAQQVQQKQNMVRDAHSYAINNHGMDPRTATDFVRWSQNPNNITIDNLIKLYAVKDAPQRQQQAQAQTKAADMRTQQERLKVPRPTTVQTGQSAPTQTEEEAFSNALLTNARR